MVPNEKRRLINSAHAQEALSSGVDIEILNAGMLRLFLRQDDDLADLKLSPSEFGLVASSVEFHNPLGILSTLADKPAMPSNPLTVKDALRGEHKMDWIAAMREELISLQDNNTFDDIEPPQDVKSLSTKWVFRTKLNADDSIRFKARLVVRGFLQKEGIDFDETYAPVATQTSFRLLVALAAKLGWRVQQLDVITAFLHPLIDKENLWVSIPQSTFELCQFKDIKQSVFRLRKALYGLRQSPRLWWATMDGVLLKLGLTRGQYDTNLYFSKAVIVLLYVDDTLIFDIAGSHLAMEYPGTPFLSEDAKALIASLMVNFKMKDLGPLKRFLGFDIERSDDGMTVCQESYINTIAARFEVTSTRPVVSPVAERSRIDITNCVDAELGADDKRTYQSLIGALLYAALGTRPDISYAVSALSRHCANPLSSHLTAARRAMRYLYTTRHLRLWYPGKSDGNSELNPMQIINGFCDSDWASNTVDRRSISGFIFLLGKSPICWKSKRQCIIALSTAEAELIACSEASREAMWLKLLITEIATLTSLGFGVRGPIKICCDNQSALKVIVKGTANPSARNKHIDIRHYHAREMQEQGIIKFEYVNTVDNLADVFTKGLSTVKHTQMCAMLGMINK